MKRILFCLFFSALFLLKVEYSFAQQEVIPTFRITPTPQETPKKINYQLAYPGLLPDSPLYPFKIARDRIVEFLISDPLKKADFYLLQADKRVNAGAYIFKKGNIALSISTISKGENYFEKALSKVLEAKKQGQDTQDLLRRLFEAPQEYQKVLKEMIQKSPPNTRSSFENLSKRAADLQKKVIEIRQK